MTILGSHGSDDDEELVSFSRPHFPVVEFTPWWGLFETIRVVRGRPLLMEEHLLNLQEGSAALGLGPPPDFRSFVTTLPPLDGRWRWIHEAHGSRHFFQTENLDGLSAHTLAVAAQRVGSQNWDARFKTLSYLTHWQARRSVSTSEALLLNEFGEVASASMSNIFWVDQGQLCAPALETGCRNGAVRRWILANFPVVTLRASLEVLTRAQEIFLTNSMIGIRPVRCFEGRDLPPGPVSLRVAEAYGQICR